MYAYWAAAAHTEEATWLGYEMVARFKARIVDAAREAVTEILTLDDGEAIAQIAADLDRRLAYLLDREKAALHTLEWLGPVQCLMVDLLPGAEQAVNRELAWARGAADLHATTLGLAPLPEPPRRALSAEEEEAGALVPVRQARGPIPLRQYLSSLGDEDRQAWLQLMTERKGRAHFTLSALALYWADGARSVLDIADLVELETGVRDVELLLAYFRLLEKLDFVAW
jgi:hypothetical protein